MNCKERIAAVIAGKPADRLPCMPITMQFACDLIGTQYIDYATNYRVLVNGQMAVAELFDLDYVNTMSDPACEAADLRGINNLMIDFIDDPAFVTDLFDFVLEMELQFAKLQVEAGAHSIGIGDAAASLVGPKVYEKFIYPYEKRMADAIHSMGALVRLHICGNTRKILAGMGRLGCDIVDLDFLAPMCEGRAAMGPEQTLLGNIDPVRILRNGTPEQVTGAIAECHRQAGNRYIVGAGCEVVRDTPHMNFKALVEYAHRHEP